MVHDYLIILHKSVIRLSLYEICVQAKQSEMSFVLKSNSSSLYNIIMCSEPDSDNVSSLLLVIADKMLAVADKGMVHSC